MQQGHMNVKLVETLCEIYEISTQFCWAVTSFVNIGAGRILLFLLGFLKLHLNVNRETLEFFESKEGVD